MRELERRELSFNDEVSSGQVRASSAGGGEGDPKDMDRDYGVERGRAAENQN